MKKHTQGFLAFVAVGCTLAGAVGWGVWRVATPESARATSESTHVHSVAPETETTSAEATTSRTTPVPAEIIPTTTDRSKLPVRQAPVSESDPFLAPNAFIPRPESGPATPTRVYAPSVTPGTESAHATATSARPTATTSQTPGAAPTDAPGASPVPAPTTATGQPGTGTVPPPGSPTTGVEPVPTNVSSSAPSSTAVAPTLIQPEPTQEATPTSSPSEPVPIVTSTVPAPIGRPDNSSTGSTRLGPGVSFPTEPSSLPPTSTM